MTIQHSSNSVGENQNLNGQTAIKTVTTGKLRDDQERSKLSEISEHTGSRQKHVSATSDEYRRGSGGHSRRTGNKSSRGTDSRHAVMTTVQVRERPAAESRGGRKLEITQRTVRNETQPSAANHQGPTVARTIYTSDRRVRPGGDYTSERPASSNTVALTVVTGWFFS